MAVSILYPSIIFNGKDPPRKMPTPYSPIATWLSWGSRMELAKIAKPVDHVLYPDLSMYYVQILICIMCRF